MICLVCGKAETADGLTTVTFQRGEFRLTVQSVPARVCPGCGEAYVEEVVAAQLLRVARQHSEDGILDAGCEFGPLRI